VASTPWSTCPEAMLEEVVSYVKNSKYLRVPEEWKHFVSTI